MSMCHLYLKKLGMTIYVDIIAEGIISRGPTCNHNINYFIRSDDVRLFIFNKENNIYIAGWSFLSSFEEVPLGTLNLNQ